MEVKSIIHFVWFRLRTICFHNFTSYMYNVVSKIKPGLNPIISIDNKTTFNQENCIGSVLDKGNRGLLSNIFISTFEYPEHCTIQTETSEHIYKETRQRNRVCCECFTILLKRLLDRHKILVG